MNKDWLFVDAQQQATKQEWFKNQGNHCSISICVMASFHH
jgi:hypothetical protein